MINDYNWRGEGEDNDDDDDKEIDNPRAENHMNDHDSFQRQQQQDWNDELDHHWETIMNDDMRRDLDNEIQQSIDDQLNAQYENYLNDYFAKAQQQQQQEQEQRKRQQQQPLDNDVSFTSLLVLPKDSVANHSQDMCEASFTTKTTTTIADINAQIQLVIDQYQSTKPG